MGLKGYRLWVMGQLDSNVQSPTTMVISRGLPRTPPRKPSPITDENLLLVAEAFTSM
jgi:hypothetical protein